MQFKNLILVATVAHVVSGVYVPRPKPNGDTKLYEGTEHVSIQKRVTKTVIVTVTQQSPTVTSSKLTPKLPWMSYGGSGASQSTSPRSCHSVLPSTLRTRTNRFSTKPAVSTSQPSPPAPKPSTQTSTTMAQPPPPIFTNPLQQTSTAIVIAPVNPSDYMSPSPFLVPAAAVQPRRNQSPSPADAKLQKRDKGSVGPRDAKRIPWLLTAWVTKEPKFDSREEKPRETGVAVARAAVSKSEVEVVKTIVVEPGPRCPYPYPHQSCGPAYTTVKTETQTRTVAGTKEKQCKTMCEDVKEEGKDGGGKKTEAKGKGSGLVTLTRTVAAIAVVQTVVASIIGDGERTA